MIAAVPVAINTRPVKTFAVPDVSDLTAVDCRAQPYARNVEVGRRLVVEPASQLFVLGDPHAEGRAHLGPQRAATATGTYP